MLMFNCVLILSIDCLGCLIWDCVEIFFCMGYFVADIFAKFHHLFSDVKKETVTFPSALQFDCVHRYFLEV